MNSRISWMPPVAALVALTLAGCSSSPISRIDANRTLYESWPLEMQSAVLEGRVLKGMTPDMVRMALGNPSRIDVRSGSNAADEVWVYSRGGGSGLAPANVSLGGSIGGIGVSSSRRGSGSPRTSGGANEEQVVFRNGVVTRID